MSLGRLISVSLVTTAMLAMVFMIMATPTVSAGDWEVETVWNPAFVEDCELQIDSSGTPHIVARGGDWESEYVRYMKWTGSSWDYYDIGLDSGYGLSLALDSNGRPHVTFVVNNWDSGLFQNSNLIYAYQSSSGSWASYNVDHDASNWMYTPKLTLDSNDEAHIAYTIRDAVDSDLYSLKYAHGTDNSWSK